MSDIISSPPSMPWILAELRRHARACPLCHAGRGCATGVSLAARWMQYEADENGIRVTIVPSAP